MGTMTKVQQGRWDLVALMAKARVRFISLFENGGSATEIPFHLNLKAL